MKERDITAYYCDFCTKRLFVYSAMERHESMCSKNPVNYQPCYECIHLEKRNDGGDEVFYEGGGEIYSRIEKSPDHFHCGLYNKAIYSIKAVQIGLVKKHPEHFEWQEPMPKSCEGLESYNN